jgi:hypothetical protein
MRASGNSTELAHEEESNATLLKDLSQGSSTTGASPPYDGQAT